MCRQGNEATNVVSVIDLPLHNSVITSLLTHLCLESQKSNIGTQCRPRSDATGISIKHGNDKN